MTQKIAKWHGARFYFGIAYIISQRYPRLRTLVFCFFIGFWFLVLREKKKKVEGWGKGGEHWGSDEEGRSIREAVCDEAEKKNHSYIYIKSIYSK